MLVLLLLLLLLLLNVFLTKKIHSFHDKFLLSSISLYEDDFDEDEDLPEGDIMALRGLENDDEIDTDKNKNKPWTMVTGIDDDIDDNDDDDDDFY